MKKTLPLGCLITVLIVFLFLILNSCSVSKDETLPVSLNLKTLPGDITTQTTGFVFRIQLPKPINNYSIAPEYSEVTVEGLKLNVYGVVLVDSEGNTDAITTYDGLTEVEPTETHPAQALETVGV